jgi:AcrR family transcriptional regulator
MACEDIYGGLRERISDVATNEQPLAQKLPAALRIYLQSCQDNRSHILLMYREYRHLPKDAHDRYMEREQAIADVFADLIGSGIRQGLFEPVDAGLLARDIILLGHFPALKSWSVRGLISPDHLMEEQITLIMRSLGSREV